MAMRDTTDALGELLSAAADRQAADQRDLRETLEGIRAELAALRRERLEAEPAAPIPPDLAETLEQIRDGMDRIGELPAGLAQLSTGIRERIVGVEERLDGLPKGLFQGVKDAVLPQLAPGNEILERVDETLSELRDGAGKQSTDVEALARSMLELNTALRDWADGVEERIASLAQTLLEGVRDLASSQGEALGSLGDAVTNATSELRDEVAASSAELRQEVGGLVRETARSLGGRLDDVHEQLSEGQALTRYLHDQVEDLDKVLNQLGDVPDRLEGAVSQALRRALTVRAGLTKEAEKALERAIGPAADQLEQLVEGLGAVSEGLEDGKLLEDVRRLSLRHVELTTRLEDMQESLVASLEDISEAGRARDELLAQAIDRAAEGLAPQATEGLEAVAAETKKPKRAAQPRKKAAKKPSAKEEKASSKKKASSSKKRTTTKKAASKKKASSQKRTTSKKAASSKKSSSTKKSSSKKKSSSAGRRSSSKKKTSSSSAKGGSGRKRGRSTKSRSGPYIPV